MLSESLHDGPLSHFFFFFFFTFRVKSLFLGNPIIVFIAHIRSYLSFLSEGMLPPSLQEFGVILFLPSSHICGTSPDDFHVSGHVRPVLLEHWPRTHHIYRSVYSL